MRAVVNYFGLGPKICYRTEVLSGMTVAFALIPEAVAFALMAGLSPLTGLYAAFTMGFITALLGGRPGMISGATGAIAVVIVSLAKDYGVEYVFAAVVLAGILQVLVGSFRLGKFIRLVPQSVMYGFVNGLAIIIFMSQIGNFKGDAGWITGVPLLVMFGLVALTIAIIVILPRLTKVFPASLAGILVTFGVVFAFQLQTRTVGDVASIQGGFPPFHIPALSYTFQTLWIILPYSCIVAAVGLIESLLTLNFIDELTDTRGRANKECIGQGIASLTTGFFSGMGGCAMIGQSMINISSGARTRISAIVAALLLLTFIMVGAPVIERVPMAALTGVMVMVAVGTFEWASLKSFGKMPVHDVVVMVVVALITVFMHNLALAVLAGVIIAALVFAWENALRIRAKTYVDEQGIKHYEILGPLFFGSVAKFTEKFDILTDPNEIIIDFRESRVADMSGIEALSRLTERYLKAGKVVHLKHLSPDCRRLLKNAESIVDVNIIEDPEYVVMKR